MNTNDDQMAVMMAMLFNNATHGCFLENHEPDRT
jgi:hypothetical protein